MDKFKIIENALPLPVFEELQGYVMGDSIPWYHYNAVTYPSTNLSFNESHDKEKIEQTKSIVAKGLTPTQKKYDYFMTHVVYVNNRIYSELAFEKLQPLIEILNPKTLIRIKINNYPQTPRVVHHQDHVDYDYTHKGALFCVNTNNGVTVIENKTEVESVENKLILFDTSKVHHGTTTSNNNRRINININYF
jgi:hypothetical protein